MIVEWKLVLIIFICLAVKIHSNILKDSDYVNFSSEYNNNFRRTFLDKRRQNIVTAKRVELIDKYLSNSSVFVDGILHDKIDEKHKHWKLVNKIEQAFRNLIGMNGVKYYYRRDSYWRTWRKVKYPEEDKMVCYRCESSRNCNVCQYASYWVIDENPPCPFEILSVQNNEEACVINYNNSTNAEEQCPTVAQFTDIMRKCNNPIDTEWRIQKVYKKEVSKRYPSIFCGGRDYCEISTYYTITPSYVTFRIVNSTNHITYSKIMKNHNTNYACALRCGIFDPKTKTVSQTGKPLIVDLINNKNKREDKIEHSTVSDETFQSDGTKVKLDKPGSTVSYETVTQKTAHGDLNKLKHAINKMETAFNLAIKKIERNDIDASYRHHDQKHPTCSSMKHRMEDEISEELNTYY